MFRLGLVDTLVTHANIKGFGLTPLSGDRRGYMPPLLKTNKTKIDHYMTLLKGLCNILCNMYDTKAGDMKDMWRIQERYPRSANGK